MATPRQQRQAARRARLQARRAALKAPARRRAATPQQVTRRAARQAERRARLETIRQARQAPRAVPKIVPTQADIPRPQITTRDVLLGGAPTAAAPTKVRQAVVAPTVAPGERIREEARALVSPALDILRRRREALLPAEQARLQQLQQLREEPTRITELGRIAEQQKQQAAARAEQQISQIQRQGERTREQLLRQLSRAGVATGTFRIEQEQALNQQVAGMQDAIRRTQMLESARIDAELRGASEEILQGINKQINEQQDRVRQLQTEFAEQEAQLQLEALEAGEIGAARFARTQQELAAQEASQRAEQEKREAQFLRSQGLIRDPRTGELVEDKIARADLLKTQAEATLKEAQALKALREPVSKFQTQFNPITGDQIIFDPVSGANIQTITPTGQVIEGGGATSQFMPAPTAEGYRTDRHNNPTAFITDLARIGGLQEGVDFVEGDPFPDDPNFTTAKILGDPIDTTIKLIDNVGFFTADGRQRWVHTAIPKSQWDSLDRQQKADVIVDMYKKEGGSGVLAGRAPTANESIVRARSVQLGKSPKEVEADVINFQRTGEMPRGQRLPQTGVARLSDGKSAFDSITQLRNIIQRWEGGPVRGLTAEVPVFGKLDIPLQKLQAKIRTTMQVVGKYMEGGVLRKEDEIKYERILPSITDTQEVAQSKYLGVLDLLSSKIKTDVEAFENAGYDVVDFQQLLSELDELKAGGQQRAIIPTAQAEGRERLLDLSNIDFKF